MRWYNVTVENEVGIIGVHAVLAFNSHAAREQEEARGLLVLDVELRSRGR